MIDDFSLACGHDPATLHSLADGILGQAERPAVEERLLSCSVCREHLSDLRFAIAAFSALPKETAPAGLSESIMRSVRSEQAGRRPLRAVAAAFATLVVIAGIALTFSPAEILADDAIGAPGIVLALDPATLLDVGTDASVVAGLCLALAASGFLLVRLLRPTEA